MAESFDFICDIHKRKLKWNFKVYVIRIWEVPSRFNEKELWSIEMVLQDSKGERIRASIQRALARKWRDKILAFQMYTMCNFIVMDNKNQSTTAPSPFNLLFSHRTVVGHVDIPSFPLEAFNFKPLSELLATDRVDETDVFDVIAQVVGKEDPRNVLTYQGRETKRLVVVLQDVDNNRVECVLFGDMVDEMVPHLDEARVEPLIIILQFFKAIGWNGKTQIQSNFHVSKLHTDANLKEIVGFRSRLLSGV